MKTGSLRQRIAYQYSEVNVKDEPQRSQGSTLGNNQVYIASNRETIGRLVTISNIRILGDLTTMPKFPIRMVIKGYSTEKLESISQGVIDSKIIDGDYHFSINPADPPREIQLRTSYIA